MPERPVGRRHMLSSRQTEGLPSGDYSSSSRLPQMFTRTFSFILRHCSGGSQNVFCQGPSHSPLGTALLGTRACPLTGLWPPRQPQSTGPPPKPVRPSCPPTPCLCVCASSVCRTWCPSARGTLWTCPRTQRASCRSRRSGLKSPVPWRPRPPAGAACCLVRGAGPHSSRETG